MPPAVMVNVPARAGLVGNPSDLYGGAVLAVPVNSFAATVEVVEAETTRIIGPPEGASLVAAAAAHAPQSGPYELRWSTTIPRTVGLAGSSAIVLAVLRALFQRVGQTVDALDLAQLALAVETDALGIVAGIQDRAVQAAGVPVLVDVGSGEPLVTPLETAQPLAIVVAWSPAAAGPSGDYHHALRARDAAGRDAGMATLGDLARAASAVFAAGDAPALATCVAESARVRSTVAPLSAAHAALADAVAVTGLWPNSTGSGGAVAAVVTDRAHLTALDAVLRPLGGQFVVETYAPADGSARS